MDYSKTVVIGLDSASWRVISPLIEQGRLPNLQKLMKEGTSGTLRSTIPPMTPSAWTSVVTGVNPGKHGIYDFVEQDRETYRIAPVNYSRMSQPALWDIFSACSKRMGVVNFPLAFPPPEVDPFFISGISSPETESFAYPAHLMGFLRSKNYRIYPRVLPDKGIENYFDAIKELTDIQIEVLLHLMKQESWDMILAVFMGIDWIQHYFWDQEINGVNAVYAFYQYMDDKLGEMLSETECDWNIVVISDHGARKIQGEIHLNRLLEEWGYLNRAEVSEAGIRKIRNSVLSAGLGLGRMFPPSVKHRMKQYLTGKIKADMAGLQSEQLRLQHMIDWDKTRAFSYGYMGHIYIHEKGKYPAGNVAPDGEYELIREEIIAKLRSLKNPETGELIVGEIFRKEDIYAGDMLGSAPDIVFNLIDFKYMVYGDFGDAWFHPPRSRVADHDMEGIFIMKGECIQRGTRVDANVVDITPTLLYLHDLPLSDNMDGRVLEEVFTPALINEREVRTVQSTTFVDGPRNEYGEAEQREIEKRLSDLGYL